MAKSTEDNLGGSTGDSDIQDRVYNKAKPLYETGVSRFASTWRRISSVRKRNKSIKRTKSEQRTGVERGPHSQADSLAPGCEKYHIDRSPTSSGSPVPNTFLSSGNADYVISSSVPGCVGPGGTLEGGSLSGNNMRPPSTTSKESETEGVVTSGYFRWVLMFMVHKN